MNFPLHIIFNNINHGHRATISKKSSLWLLASYIPVATYCYYEKVHRSMRTAIVSCLINRPATPPKILELAHLIGYLIYFYEMFLLSSIPFKFW